MPDKMLSFNFIKKNLKKDFSGFKKVKLALLSDTASQFLTEAIRGYGYEMQLDFEIYEAGFNQIDLQIFDPLSQLYSFAPDIVFINRSTEGMLTDFYKKEVDAQRHYAADLALVTSRYYNTIAAKLRSKVIINTYPEIDDAIFGNYAAKVSSSFINQQRLINVKLMELAQELTDLFICDFAGLQARLGRELVFDPKMYINAGMVYSLDFLPYIAKNIVDIILAINGFFKKCLVLDLDNTIWGGIIGDDGVEGIQIGGLGEGKSFTELQMWAKQLKNRGIILAICSKNTEELAKEPFISHPDMVLRLEDIAVFVANWETKVANLRHIQSVLNIGFDSMVFLDDNPFEREMVKSAIPEISVPDLPEEPAEYLMFLRSLNLFETASFTEEDEQRTKKYQDEARRNVLMQRFENENDFLAELGMVSEVQPFNDFSIPRVAQLSMRSNQFNLRTVRYTEQDLKLLCKDPDYFTISLTLNDKFGDHGLISAIILKKQESATIFVDTWIMSCRVLNRGVEQFSLNNIVALAKEQHCTKIKGEFIPTKKNGIVKDHYRNLGFKEAGDNFWELDVDSYLVKSSFINKK